MLVSDDEDADGTIEATPEQAFTQLVKDLSSELHRYISQRVPPDQAEDVLSDVFLVVWRRWDAIPDELGARRAWIYVVVKRTVSDRQKRLHREQARARRLAAEPVQGPEDPSTSVLGSDRVRRLLAALPPEQAQALILTVVEGLTAREAGLTLGVSATAITSRASRARASLRAHHEAGRRDHE